MGKTKWTEARSPRHVRIYRRQMQSPAWRSLSGSAVKVMLAIADFENGSNNGEIFLSDRVGAEITGMSRNTVRRSIDELIKTGFIYCTAKGGFSRKTPHAATYGLTWQAGPKDSPWRAPSHAYEAWQASENGNTRAQILTETGPDFEPSVETFPNAGPDIEPGKLEKRLVSVTPHVSKIEPQTCNHTPWLEDAPIGNWKQGQETRSADFVTALRERLVTYLEQADAGEQSRIAMVIECPPGTLSKFIHGRSLPDRYLGVLAKALIRPAPGQHRNEGHPTRRRTSRATGN